MTDATRRLDRAGLVLGIGLGGFVDGIVLHQILQWHQMLSTRVPPVDLVSAKVNMVWDGVFHAAMWLVCVAGVVLLWRAAVAAQARGQRLSGHGRRIAGAMLIGWAGFNVIEGIVDHHVLGLHHVREFVASSWPWDIGFLVASLAIGGIGWTMMPRAPANGTRTGTGSDPLSQR